MLAAVLDQALHICIEPAVSLHRGQLGLDDHRRLLHLRELLKHIWSHVADADGASLALSLELCQHLPVADELRRGPVEQQHVEVPNVEFADVR